MPWEPYSSPWGAIENCKTITPGVYNVQTARHGGIMVSIDAAGFLSQAAKESAGKFDGYPGYLCYEEDCDYQIVLRELLDKGLWQIPEGKNKTAYERNLNESLQYWNPQYWQGREKALTEAGQTKEAGESSAERPKRSITDRLATGKEKADAHNAALPKHEPGQNRSAAGIE